MPSNLDELDVKVYVDYPQSRRNVKAPFVYAVDGTSWDTSTAVNCYIEPVTRAVMGQPIPNTPEWKTTFTGQGYARFLFADFTFTSPSSWKDINFYSTTDPYFYCLSNSVPIMNGAISLNGGVSRNQPLFFSFIRQNKKESNTNITAKLFWAGNSFVNRDTQLHLKDDGSCDIYRGYILKTGTIVCSTSSATVTGTGTLFTTELAANDNLYTEDGRIIGTVLSITNATTLILFFNPTFNYTGRFHNKQPQKVASYSRNENNYNQQAVGIRNGNPNNDYNDVYIMPMRGKELVINTNYGLNFSHTFEDLVSPNDVGPVLYYMGGYSAGSTAVPGQAFMVPEILPTGAFSIVIPNGKVAFQLAKLCFLSNWTIKSKNIYNEVAAQGFSNFGYRTVTAEVGTISSSTYSNTVTGVGTGFLTSWVGGRLFSLESDGFGPLEIGTIFSVASTTSLTLTGSGKFKQASSFTLMKKKTGTITASTSSNIITGVGTLFTTEVAVNDDIYDPNDYYLGKVQSISSNTSMTLYYNSMTDCSTSAYWTNLPVINSVFQNNQVEVLGPANTTQISDILPPSLTILGNGTGQSLSSSSYFVIQATSQSTIAPTNPLKNNDSSFTFYSVDVIIFYENQKTKTTQIDITSVVESLLIEKTEEGENGCTFSARKQNLIDLGMTNPDRLSNRPVKITLKPRDLNYDEILIFEGFLKNPEIEYIQGPNYDKYSLLTFEGYDRKQALNEVYFTKAPSLDGLSLQNAFIVLGNYGGLAVKPTFVLQDQSLLGYDLGFNRNNSNGQYNWTANISDSVGSFIEKLRSELTQNIAYKYTYGWFYNTDYNRFLNAGTVWLTNRNTTQPYNNTFSVPLYLSETNANTFGSIALSKAYKRTIRNLKKTYEQPEANQVIVIGTDKTNNDRLTAIIDDVNSQNPFITNRPNNWLGLVKSFCYQNDRLTTQNIVESSAQSFFDKITTGREIVEFTSDYLTYYNNFTKYPNAEPLPAKNGTIDSFTYSNGIGGVGTLFLSQLAIGDKLYSPDGYLIGTVATIASNTSLTLTTNALYAVTSSQYYTRNPYILCDQYAFLDCDQDVEIFDTTGTSTGYYKILSYKVEFVKANIPVYVLGVLQKPDQINVTQATYKAVKVNYTNKANIYEDDKVNLLYSNVVNVQKNVASKTILRFITSANALTFTTSGVPSGMTVSSSTFDGSTQNIIFDWTPSPAQTKSVANVSLTVTNSYGTGKSLTVPLYFKVFDTL